jgi:monoterpene epsilon-lactone hydrolase
MLGRVERQTRKPIANPSGTRHTVVAERNDESADAGREAMKYLVRSCVTAGLLIAASSLSSMQVQAQTDPTLTPADGTVVLDDVQVPPSDLMSAEARAYLRHLIVDKPFGAPLPDIKAERVRQDGIMRGFLEPMRRRYKVKIAEQRIGGIVTDVVTPAAGIAPENRERVLINLHGGGFTTGGRSASLVESVPLAAIMGIKVVSVDYRMSPEHAFPAASDDVEAVYRELLKTYKPEHMVLYGCSAGGMLTAEVLSRFHQAKLPMPAAAGVFCASLGALIAGDSGVLAGPLNGFKMPPAKPGRSAAPAMAYLAAARADDPLAYPLVSPDTLRAFPPTLFISGTRAFEMSAALNSHNALAKVGVESQFHAWDGMNHGFFYNSELPESREAYAVMGRFFTQHMAR